MVARCFYRLCSGSTFLGLELHRAHLHPFVGRRLVLGGMGLDLPVVERHVTNVHQAGLLAQLEHLVPTERNRGIHD